MKKSFILFFILFSSICFSQESPSPSIDPFEQFRGFYDIGEVYQHVIILDDNVFLVQDYVSGNIQAGISLLGSLSMLKASGTLVGFLQNEGAFSGYFYITYNGYGPFMKTMDKKNARVYFDAINKVLAETNESKFKGMQQVQ